MDELVQSDRAARDDSVVLPCEAVTRANFPTQLVIWMTGVTGVLYDDWRRRCHADWCGRAG